MTTLTLILAIFIAQNSPESIQEARAAMRLGARAAHVQRNLPVLNQVVLVPDEATYLDEISRWSPRARWPVLFDREPLASQFIRRFNPEKIWRREPVKTKIDDIEIAMQRAVASAWGGTDSIESALAYLKLPPLGVVLTSTKDSARTGAVALAAGRGQLLEYISGEWGTTGETLDGPRTKSLIREIEGVLKSTGTKYADIGDTIDALTICQTLPSRVTSSQQERIPLLSAMSSGGTSRVSGLLGRGGSLEPSRSLHMWQCVVCICKGRPIGSAIPIQARECGQIMGWETSRKFSPNMDSNPRQ